MKIGIIGSGKIGGTLGTLWAKAGHDIMFSSRHPPSLALLVADVGPRAQAGTPDQAAAFGEVVLIAIPFRGYPALPADKLAGKIVIDATNYDPQRDGQIDLHNGTSSELIAQHLPDVRLVKAFNTMYYETLRTQGRPDRPAERLVLFLAGDDRDAKQVVAQLIEEIDFMPIDTGSLREGGRRQEPGSPIYNRPLTAEQAQTILASLR